MKVKELIEKLQTLDPELEVVIAYGEEGVESVTDVSEPEVYVRNAHTDSWNGSHALLEYLRGDYDEHEKFLGVSLYY